VTIFGLKSVELTFSVKHFIEKKRAASPRTSSGGPLLFCAECGFELMAAQNLTATSWGSILFFCYFGLFSFAAGLFFFLTAAFIRSKVTDTAGWW
jgi:hypothetical protein